MSQQANSIIWLYQEEDKESPRRITDAEAILMEYREIVERFQRITTREGGIRCRSNAKE